ncbi:MAG: dephospho-CoA kinase [Acidobacteriales bacterium]|nr:dephospho-CoA kinase [Terriglobales bacterium]
MLKVGLTGGIASGKSTVGAIFVSLGAHLIQADQIAHDLMRPGEEVYRRVVEAFGRGILQADGSIDRPRLADAAFRGTLSEDQEPRTGVSAPQTRVKELNAIVHPAVIKRQEEWFEEVRRQDANAIAIVEAALILEAGSADRFDKIVVVTCRPEQRIERWARRFGISEEAARDEVTRRMAAQLPDEEKIKVADYVIDNSGGLEETKREAERVWGMLHQRGSNL